MFFIQRDPVSALGHRRAPQTRLRVDARVYGTLGHSVAHVGLRFFLRQPISQDQLIVQQLKQIGPDAIHEAGYQDFDRNMMQIVVVGDPKIIREQVDSLKLGVLRWSIQMGCLIVNP